MIGYRLGADWIYRTMLKAVGIIFVVIWLFLWFFIIDSSAAELICPSDMGYAGYKAHKTGQDILSLLPAIKFVESSGDMFAYNNKSRCRGLYQISNAVLREYNVNNETKYDQDCLFSPTLNKEIAIWYLLKLKKHYLKDDYTVERMLAAYNMGYSRLKKLNWEWWRIKETREYVLKVLKTKSIILKYVRKEGKEI